MIFEALFIASLVMVLITIVIPKLMIKIKNYYDN